MHRGMAVDYGLLRRVYELYSARARVVYARSSDTAHTRRPTVGSPTSGLGRRWRRRRCRPGTHGGRRYVATTKLRSSAVGVNGRDRALLKSVPWHPVIQGVPEIFARSTCIVTYYDDNARGQGVVQ